MKKRLCEGIKNILSEKKNKYCWVLHLFGDIFWQMNINFYQPEAPPQKKEYEPSTLSPGWGLGGGGVWYQYLFAFCGPETALQ